MKLTPTTLGNRIEALDLLRGVALLGIFIANMLLFHSPYLYLDPYTWFSTPSDMATFKWIDIFVEASFYPIFAMLFGYGLNMQYEKSLANGTSFAPVMARRLGILLAFGLLHGIFIWSGDVLFTYALMGFIMIAFVRVPRKWLVIIAAILYIVPCGLMVLALYFLNKWRPDAMMDGYADLQQIELSISAYAHGTYGEILVFRFFEWLIVGLGGSLMGFFIVLPLIILGAALSKWKVIERAAELKGKIVAVTIVAIAAGIWMKVGAVRRRIGAGCNHAAIVIRWTGSRSRVRRHCLALIPNPTVPYRVPTFNQSRADVVDDLHNAIGRCDAHLLWLRLRHVWKSRPGYRNMDCGRCLCHPSHLCGIMAYEV